MGDISLFPMWKQLNATPEEKLREALAYKAKHPEDMKKVLIIWEGEDGLVHYECESDLIVRDAVFMLETTKLMLMGLVK